MAMNFTVKDAKHLIERHKELIANLDYVITRTGKIRSDVMQSAKELLAHPELGRIILKDCTYAPESIRNSNKIGRFIHDLYKQQKIKHDEETAKAYKKFAVENIFELIDDLNPGLVGLSWLFGGKRAKENATRAYQELTNILNESYAQDIPQLVSNVYATARVGIDEAWCELDSNPYAFRNAVEEILPSVLTSKTDGPFRDIFAQLETLENKISRCQEVTNKEQELVKASAEKVMAYNALQILKNVPVEELGREKTGFRIKALRDAGIITMADVYSASTYQLSSIYGVSDNAAFSMKRIAKKFLEEACDGIKIKLSADDRNKQSTELIRAIYLYRLKNISREQLKNIVQEKQYVLENAKEMLRNVKNGLPWVFYSSEERQNVRNAYTEVNEILKGDYAKAINKLTGILMKENSSPAANTVWNDFKLHNIEYISILEEIVPGALGNDDVLYGLPEDLAREIQEEIFFPEGLLCTLRRYQEWGVKYILHQKKVLLGDEMGLGKTVQAIATMVSLRNTGATHFMVVCPASVVTNWCREVVKHSKLRVTKIHGAGRMQALKSWVKTGGVAVTTFETTSYIKNESVEKIDLLIVDEAHYIKNPEARRSINVTRLCTKAERLLFMTGTALENRVDEMVYLISVLQPNISAAVQNLTFMSNAPQFRERVAPVYYRRKREDVLTELPKLIETKEWCVLNPREKEIYEENILAKRYVASRRLSWDVDDIKESCKATRLLEIIDEAKSEDRKIIVFSFFLDTIRSIGELLGARCYGPINGSVPPPRRQEIIDEFDSAPAGSVLLAQIQSGGTGLNIQSASVVVICEPQLKPSIENQAISRAYRMGQARNVLVYRLLCENTIDEKITKLLEEKQEIFDAFADKSVAAQKTEAGDVEIDEKKFGQLIQEEIDRINSERK